MAGLKLQTPVAETPCAVGISYSDRILLLGSCFSDSIGKSLIDYGFDALVNPFGTMYNPASICSALRRLASGAEFTEADCVPMGSLPKGGVPNAEPDGAPAGAGAGRICSFSHHTSFARSDSATFLENANASLRSATEFFRSCNKVIVTLGTAWCFRYMERNMIVSNCLKRDTGEFSRERLSVTDCAAYLNDIIALCCGKDIIFTVSPIRHMADGAHGNQLSKSTLLLAVDQVIAKNIKTCDYFPAYEIMMDELRDYRFWAEDMVHPSAQAAAYITDRFLSRHLSPADAALLDANIRAYKRSLHRPIL